MVSSRILLLCVLFLIAAPTALADDEPDYSRFGPYGTLSLAAGTSTGLDEFLQPALPDTENARTDAAVGVSARAGLRLFSFLALEGQAEYLPGFNVKVSNDQVILDGELVVVTFNAKGYFLAWHDTGRFEPFVLVGVGWMRNWADGLGTFDSFASRFGAGFDGYITEHIAVTVDVTYVPPAAENEEWDYVSLNAGLMFKF